MDTVRILDFGFWIQVLSGAWRVGAAKTPPPATAIENRKSRIQRGWLAFALALLLAAGGGCTRAFWRGRADREVAYLVAEKSNNPRWALPAGFNLNIDPRSRYYDPTNPDHPPLPPDDPYSHVYMHRVDGKRGAPWWHLNGELPQLANPGWRQRLAEYCEMTPEGAVKLDLPGALALSYIHQPQHRSQLETLYLSALDVSAERFRFNLQFYPGSSVSFLRAGQKANGVQVVPPSPANPAGISVPRSQLTVVNGTAPGAPGTLTREFATGGTLLVNFANTFVWQLAGPHTNTANSLINMSLVQPLLAGGGRIITMETLTLAERTLLSNLRWYERWRQAWFMYLSVGTNNTGANTLQRAGGGFGGTGITGFSGNGIGGLGGVAANAGFSGVGNFGGGGGLGGGATAAVAGAAGGGTGNLGVSFYSILQQQVNIDNAQNALNLQVRTLRLLEAYLEAGLINIAQVDLFRQSVETSKANIISARIALENGKDSFKQALLGLPPDLPVVFDDQLIKQFQLIDPRLNELQVALAEYMERIGALPARVSVEDQHKALDDLGELRDQVAGALPATYADLRTLDARTETRTRKMTPAERKEFMDQKQRLRDSATELQTRVEQEGARLANMRETASEDTSPATLNGAVALAGNLSGLTQEIALVKASAKLESIVMLPIELSTVDALQIARAHRLDWMNIRAKVVDQWRLIFFNANSLRSVLNLTVNGSLGTVDNNMIKFAANNGSLNLGAQFAPPLTRLLQRNNYRQALINYQSVRRLGIQYEDGINISLRGDMRALKNFEVNFEIQRQAVRIAVRRVDNTREELNEPPPPVQPGQPPAALGPTAASNLLTALQALSDSQNNLMSAWLQHYDERQQLYNDLGIMRLDNRGMWVDEPIDQGLAQLEQMYPLPPELPIDWLKDAGLTPPALYPTEGVPPLGGTTQEVQAAAATPETPRPRFDIQRPSERVPERERESLPAPAEEPRPRLDAPAAPEELPGAAPDEEARQAGGEVRQVSAEEAPAADEAAGDTPAKDEPPALPPKQKAKTSRWRPFKKLAAIVEPEEVKPGSSMVQFQQPAKGEE